MISYYVHYDVSVCHHAGEMYNVHTEGRQGLEMENHDDSSLPDTIEMKMKSILYTVHNACTGESQFKKPLHWGAPHRHEIFSSSSGNL